MPKAVFANVNGNFTAADRVLELYASQHHFTIIPLTAAIQALTNCSGFTLTLLAATIAEIATPDATHRPVETSSAR